MPDTDVMNDGYTPEELLERVRTRRPVGEYDGEIVREVLEEMFRRVAEISETARCLQQEVWDADLQIARVRRIHTLCKDGLEANDKEYGTDYQRGCAYAFGVIKAKLYEALYVADRELTPEEIAYGLTLQPDADAANKKTCSVLKSKRMTVCQKNEIRFESVDGESVTLLLDDAALKGEGEDESTD